MNEAEQLLNKYYQEKNYKIVNLNNKSNICYVFFSSNGLYKDRNDVSSIEDMHNQDRYEWKYITSNKKIRKKAKKIILLRDIYKAFYISGINSTISKIDDIKSFLCKETRGMQVILAGSSAGAYMALLMGNLLPNTKRVISLGGVIDLEDWHDFSIYFQNNLSKSDYPNISKYLYGDYWVINFYAFYDKNDKKNAELLNNLANSGKLINVGINVDTHAPRPTGKDLIELLVCKDEHLNKLKSATKSPCDVYVFRRYNLGFASYIFLLATKKIIKLKHSFLKK